MIKKIAVIVAAGSGVRMGSATPKQFLLLQQKPVLWHSISAFQNAFKDIEILLVVSPQHFSVAEEIRLSSADPSKIKIVAGGKTRFESVRNGLRHITDSQAIVFVHDAVRCLLSGDLIKRCYDEAGKMGSAIPSIAIQDSLRLRSDKSFEPVDRNKIIMIQTPQTFRADILLKAFKQDDDDRFTDESIVVQKSGEAIHFIAGEDFNIKITRPVDLLLAEAILATRGKK